jgi:hypothetical protein
MPRSRPGKKERASKRANDQQALSKLNERLQTDRADNAAHYKSDSKVSKPNTEERKFSPAEVEAIVQAAVTVAVTTTTTLLTGVKPQQSNSANKNTEKARPLAERIQFPKKSLAERIVFPNKQ